ncbi:MAG: hypothetical protein CSB15_00550 [Clostridiales bacterium]|nr:MAG: hypothetical protein CSB15_00550 [Clostridiales bacterium]
MKKISILLVLFLLFNVAFADSKDNSHLKDKTLNKVYKGGLSNDVTKEVALSADYSTEVFDNGDGTFSYYVIRNTTVKQPDWGNENPKVTPDMKPGHLLFADKGDFTMNYLPVPDDAKFQDVRLWANPEIEVLSAVIINQNNNDTSTVSVEKTGVQQIVKWKASQSNDTKIKFLKYPKHPFINWIDIPPLSTLKVVVKPKENYIGSILPFKSVTGKGKFYKYPGPDAPSEIKYDHAFIRGFVVKKDVKPVVTTKFFEKDFSKEIETIEKGKTVGVQYIVGNPNNVDKINFVQNLELENVTIDGVISTDIVKDKAFDLIGLTGKNQVVIKGTLAVNETTEAIATAKVIQKFSTNVAPATHILGSDALNKDDSKKIGNVDTLGNGKYFRYRPENKIDDDNVFPALEGETMNIEESPYFKGWIYGYTDRSENGYKPGIQAFNTDYIYNGTNTVTNKEVIVTDKDTLKVTKPVMLTTRWVELGNETHTFKKEVTDKEFKEKAEKFEEKGFTYECVETKTEGNVKTYYYAMKAIPLVPSEKKVTTRWVELGNETHTFKKEVTDKEFKEKAEKFEEKGFTYEYVETKTEGNVKTYYYAMKAIPLVPSEKKVTTRWVELGNETNVLKEEVVGKVFDKKEEKFEKDNITYEWVETKNSADKLVRIHYYLRKSIPLKPSISKKTTIWLEQNTDILLKATVIDKDFFPAGNIERYNHVKTVEDGNTIIHYFEKSEVVVIPTDKKDKIIVKKEVPITKKVDIKKIQNILPKTGEGLNSNHIALLSMIIGLMFIGFGIKNKK